MAPPTIRHLSGCPAVKLKGEPSPFLRPWEIIHREGEFYYVRREVHDRIRREHVAAVRFDREQRRQLLRERRHADTLFGPGSGLAGGGRGAARVRAHRMHVDRASIVSNVTMDECPLCFSKPLAELWLKAGSYGVWGWLNLWEPWPENEVVYRALAKLKLRERERISTRPKELAAFREQVLSASALEVQSLRRRLDRADEVCDNYMKIHRHPEDSVLNALAPWKYERDYLPYRRQTVMENYYKSLADETTIATETHSNPEPLATHDTATPTEIGTHQEELFTHGAATPTETGTHQEEPLTHGDPMPTQNQKNQLEKLHSNALVEAALAEEPR